MAGRKVTVVARLTAKKGKEKETENALLALVAPTRREAGCLNYDLHRGFDDRCRFLIHENWEKGEDLDRHLGQAHVRKFLALAQKLLDGEPEITFWEEFSPK
ncbi:MAG: putative quinol monooxygenase [Candidatus Glassbacteria bacterium]